MRILDRYIIRAFLFNYLLALGVLAGLYVLLDLIVNFDTFTRASAAAPGAAGNATAWNVVGGILDYYAYQLLMIFQQVSGAVPLLAAGFTMFRMTRHNELAAMLSSGVSLYRVAAPIILVSIGFSALIIINQECIISQDFVVQKLLRPHGGDASQTITRNDPIYFVRDSDNSLLLANAYIPRLKQLKDVRIIKRDKSGTPIGRIMADTATWDVPPGELTEAWIMREAMQIDDRIDADPAQRVAGKVNTIVYRTGLTPRQLDLIFQKKAVEFLSSAQVRELAAEPTEVNKAPLYKVMYMRFTQPLMNIILLLIGIPFLLTRVPNALVKNMLYCVGVVGVVFAATFVIFQMSGTALDPLLAAWLPVLIFGPFSLVMLDTIRT